MIWVRSMCFRGSVFCFWSWMAGSRRAKKKQSSSWRVCMSTAKLRRSMRESGLTRRAATSPNCENCAGVMSKTTRFRNSLTQLLSIRRPSLWLRRSLPSLWWSKRSLQVRNQLRCTHQVASTNIQPQLRLKISKIELPQYQITQQAPQQQQQPRFHRYKNQEWRPRRPTQLRPSSKLLPSFLRPRSVRPPPNPSQSALTKSGNPHHRLSNLKISKLQIMKP